MKISIAPALAALTLGVAALVSPSAASAANLTFTNTVGGSTAFNAGVYTLTSTDLSYSVLRFVLDQDVDFSDLTSLNLDYTNIQGGVGAGTPRIAVVTDANHDGTEDGQFLIQLGPAGSFFDASFGPHSSGNLLTQNDNGRYDLTGLNLPTQFYTNYDAALAAAGDSRVLRFSIIVDSLGNDRTFEIGANGLTAGAAGVPEPATWALMIGGFGFAGATLRRRKAVAARV